MHAAAACYLSGTGLDEISSGLASFKMGFETTPGRLNIYDGLPFRVIMDYAHNADGFRQLCEFIDKQKVAGRKIIMVAMSGDRQDEAIMAAVSELAGHFDHFVCRSYPDRRGRAVGEVGALLKAGLLQAGVPTAAIDTLSEPSEAIRFSLNLAVEGDLLILQSGSTEFASIWAEINSYGTESEKPVVPATHH
jgi:cyanophycin synthetase